jgi:hypothetical protein
VVNGGKALHGGHTTQLTLSSKVQHLGACVCVWGGGGL